MNPKTKRGIVGGGGWRVACIFGGTGSVEMGVSLGAAIFLLVTWGVEVIRGNGKVSFVSTVSFESISTSVKIAWRNSGLSGRFGLCPRHF